MSWKFIRLELGCTREFPEGSASRVYLLRLPLRRDGLVDEAMLATEPARATVRRFWPNEADLAGYVVRTPHGWAFSYETGEAEAAGLFHFEMRSIRLGESLTLTEPDGRRLPFRAASVKEIASLVPKVLAPPPQARPRTRSAALLRGSTR